MSKLPWNVASGERDLQRTGRTSPPTRATLSRTSSRFPAFQLAILVLGVMAFLTLCPILIYQIVYADRVYLGVKAMGLDLGGYSAKEAETVLAARFAKYAQTEMIVRYGGREWRTTPGAFGVRFDAQATVQRAMRVGRSGGLGGQLADQLGSLRDGRTVLPIITFDTSRQTAVISGLAREIDQPMVNASLVTRPEGTVELVASQVGRKVDLDETLRRVQRALDGMQTGSIDLAVVETPPRVVEAQLAEAKATADRILSGPLTIVHDRESVTLDVKTLTSMLAFRVVGDKTVAELDEKALAEIVTEMAKKIDRQPRDARFRFVGGRVELIAESEDGQTVQVGPSVEAIRESALGSHRIVPLVVAVQQPKVKSSDLSKIVIRDKIIEASTVFGDTGLERQHNIRLAVSRLNGVVIPPGQTFSFNEALGPTTVKDGYKVAWGIISTPGGHETVQSEAGGICQVSTTLFHAALWAGLRIDERKEHLYWIPRYGQPPLGKTGLDSTVDGSGSADTLDFKFTNNTPNWIAVEGRTDQMKMYFALYGVKPDWTVEVSEPVITNVVKADKTVVRQFDPALKPGQEVWVEVAQDGFDVSLTRIVRQGDRILDEYVIKSHYRPAGNVIKYGPPPTPSPTPAPAGEQPTPTATPAPQPTQTQQP